MLYTAQSGFRKHYSTSTALIKTIDKWNVEIDNENYFGAVFIDLSKAFDMVNHKLLIQKLCSLGISGAESSLFKSYLQNRTQCVLVNGKISKPNTITSGVPQGSILGPLLFLFFINDMPSYLNNSIIDMYADDTLIYVCNKEVSTIKNLLNDDLIALSKLLTDNEMKANVKKTKVMLLGTPIKTSRVSNIMVSMNGRMIEK